MSFIHPARYEKLDCGLFFERERGETCTSERAAESVASAHEEALIRRRVRHISSRAAATLTAPSRPRARRGDGDAPLLPRPLRRTPPLALARTVRARVALALSAVVSPGRARSPRDRGPRAATSHAVPFSFLSFQRSRR
jgi:hypothetical protein